MCSLCSDSITVLFLRLNMENLIDISLVEDAEKAVNESKLIIETPILTCSAKLFELDEKISLFLKLENMQTNGNNC